MSSLRFNIAGGSYQQVMHWQREIDESVLCHQIETRGQALVVRRDGSGDQQKVNTLPNMDIFEPYYGVQGGAYRYSFHPLNDACELEVTNQMGGFAFYYPRRFEPLHLYLFQPPALVETRNEDPAKPPPGVNRNCLYQNLPDANLMHFSLPSQLYSTFLEWPWARRPLYAYDFIFFPGSASCQLHVRARESGTLLELTQGTML